MKKAALFGISLLMTILLQAQVIINLQLPPMGITIKQQLWNLSLVNTGGAPVQIQLEMTMTDRNNSQRVLTGFTRVFYLPQGTKQLQLSDVMPITYNVGTPGYGQDANPDGFLPAGQFSVCFTVNKIFSDASEILGQECETIEVEPLSPPQLVIPADGEQTELARPIFTWTPPTPFHLFNNLRFDWMLVEVQPLQSAADAIQQNVPVLTRQNIAYSNFQYPLSMPELDTAKQYAWRITAKNGLSPIANSEVWSFRVKRFGLDGDMGKGAAYYTKLRREEDASYIICSNTLFCEYRHEINDTLVNVRAIDITDATRQEAAMEQEIPVRYGQNFLKLDLENTNVKDKRRYLLELTNANKEKWYLKFEYRRPG